MKTLRTLIMSAPRSTVAMFWLIALVIGSSAAIGAPFAYITNGSSNTVSVIYTATNTVVATIPVGIGPNGVAVNPAGTFAYVANGGGNTVSVIDTATNTVVATVPVGLGPQGVAFNPAGTFAYVANNNSTSSSVSVINTGTHTVVATVSAGSNPFGVAVNPAGTFAYVVNVGSYSVSVINTATNTVVATVPMGAHSYGIAVNPAGTRVYVTNGGSTTVTVIDAATNTVVTTVPVGTFPLGVAVAPAGTFAYVTNQGSNTVSVINTATNTVAATVPVGTNPYGVAVNPASTFAYVTNQGSNNVSVIDTATNTVVATVPVGSAPTAFGQFIGGSSLAIGPQLATNPTAIDFGGQSMGTTSPSKVVTVTNFGGAAVTVSNVSVTNAQFAQTNNCTSVAAGASCTIDVTFSPAATSVGLTLTTPVSGTLTITSNASGSPNTVSLAGTAEKSLVTHYYQSILRRAPDSGGATFWAAEAVRLQGLGANVNETWFAMAMNFYFSAEYAAFARNDTDFVTDLYNTFFNRTPDGAGLAFWTGQLGSGLPREVALAAFMFSTEFANFTQAIFSNTAARAEVNVVVDFYRGLLSRLPDTGGFNTWVLPFRTAQCQGASAVNTQVEAISSAFANSAEYGARARTNAQYVGDLYNAFLRRGGDLPGVQFWINQIATGAQTRDAVRRQFVASTEFQGRVQAVIAQGCLPNFTLAVTLAGTGHGAVSASPPGNTYSSGTVVTLTANPDVGSTFAGWSGPCTGTGTCQVTMNGNVAVTATFNVVASSCQTNNTADVAFANTNVYGETMNVLVDGGTLLNLLAAGQTSASRAVSAGSHSVSFVNAYTGDTACTATPFTWAQCSAHTISCGGECVGQGWFNVTVDPYADIWVDDQFRGHFSASVQLNPGPHFLSVRDGSGRECYSQTVYVSACVLNLYSNNTYCRNF